MHTREVTTVNQIFFLKILRDGVERVSREGNPPKAPLLGVACVWQVLHNKTRHNKNFLQK